MMILFLKNCFKGVKLIFENEPQKMLFYSLFAIIHGMSWVFEIIVMQRFFDVAELYSQKMVSADYAVLCLIVMGLIFALCQLMNGVDNCYSQILNRSFGKTINMMIVGRVNKSDNVDFENTEYLNKMNKAIAGGENLLWVCMTLTDLVFFYSTYFFVLSFYLYTLKPVLIICVVLVFIPCIISNYFRFNYYKDLEEKISPLRREIEHYEECMTGKKCLKETRMLGLHNFFMDRYMIKLKEHNKYFYLAQVKKVSTTLLFKMLNLAGYVAIIFLIFLAVMERDITLGSFAAVLTSINRIFGFMSEIISERLGWASDNLGSVQNFFDFMMEASESRQEITVQNCDIILKDASFRYPMSGHCAINQVNIHIKHGETVAIVGENGSGKTTLCRMIIGLYKPTEGKVFYGYKSSDNYRIRNISAVFQNYCKYQMTLKDNVAISQLDNQSDVDKIFNVCDKAGVHADEIPYNNGLDTFIGRDFDGIELSGGQWQRISIARGDFREHEIVVLDEPTSAIDPIEETVLYNNFIEMCKNKTAIIVTHRLASVKNADRIIVMKGGKVVQIGNHKELIAVEGEYCRLYNMQKQWYVSTDDAV